MPDYIKSVRTLVGNQLLFMPSVSAAVVDNQNQILCICRSDNGEWDLPGGYLELGEQPALATVREVFEETGLKVIPDRLLGVFGNIAVEYPNGDKVEMVITLFLCRIISGELKARDGEALELRFFEADDLPSSPLLSRLPIKYTDLLDKQEASFVWQDDWLETLKP